MAVKLHTAAVFPGIRPFRKPLTFRNVADDDIQRIIVFTPLCLSLADNIIAFLDPAVDIIPFFIFQKRFHTDGGLFIRDQKCDNLFVILDRPVLFMENNAFYNNLAAIRRQLHQRH